MSRQTDQIVNYFNIAFYLFLVLCVILLLMYQLIQCILQKRKEKRELKQKTLMHIFIRKTMIEHRASVLQKNFKDSKKFITVAESLGATWFTPSTTPETVVDQQFTLPQPSAPERASWAHPSFNYVIRLFNYKSRTMPKTSCL